MTGSSAMLALDRYRLPRQNAVLLAHNRLRLEHQPVALVARIDDRRGELRIGSEMADRGGGPVWAAVAGGVSLPAEREFLPVGLPHIEIDLQRVGAAERSDRHAGVGDFALLEEEPLD